MARKPGNCQMCGTVTSQGRAMCLRCSQRKRWGVQPGLPAGVLVDECFMAAVSGRVWSFNKAGYVVTYGPRMSLHQFVWKLSGRPLPRHPLTIDHANRNPCDNRLENLRVATQQLQNYNTKDRPRLTHTLPRGVYFMGSDGKKTRAKPYAAKIMNRGKQIYCGYHATPEEASAAYEKKRAELMSVECSLAVAEQVFR